MEFKMRRRFDHVCLPMYRLNWIAADGEAADESQRSQAPDSRHRRLTTDAGTSQLTGANYTSTQT